MTQQYDANAVLMGGGGAPSWKFAEPGTIHVGTIAEPPKAVQEREYIPDNPGGGEPKFFPSGDPIMGVHVVLQTDERDASIEDDDGRRTFYCEGRYIKEAVRNAVRNAGASGLEVGGKLTVQFTHREDPMDKRSRKFWQVDYQPAGNTALMNDTPQTQPAAAAPAPAPQSAAPAAPPAQPPAQPQAPAAAAAPTNEQMAAFLAWQKANGQAG